MTLRVAASKNDALLLDGVALRALIAAVECQLRDWYSKRLEDLGEDDFADLQNDIQYLEILLANLRSEYHRVSPVES